MIVTFCPCKALRLLRELVETTSPPNVAWVNTGDDLQRLENVLREARIYLDAHPAPEEER